MNYSNTDVERTVKTLSKIIPKTFFFSVKCSRLYCRANNKNMAIKLVRFYECYDHLRVDVAKELFKLRAYYKVVRLFSDKDVLSLEEQYGVQIVELVGDCYFSMRKFDVALNYYEHVIKVVKGAKTSRIKSAECYYHCGNLSRCLFRLEQYMTRYGKTERSDMLYERITQDKKTRKHEGKKIMQKKYGVNIHYKLEMI